MGLKRSADKNGQISGSERIVEQLKQCYCRLRLVNEEIRAQRRAGELPGSGVLMGEQKDLLQRIQRLRNGDLPTALLHEEMAERDGLPGQVEDLRKEISGARSRLLEEVLSEAEGFFSKLVLVGGRVANEGASLVLPLEIRDCLSRSMAAAEKSDIRNLEGDLARKRVALNMGIGVLTEGKANSLNTQAMARAREEQGFDMERDFFDPLYRDRT